MHLYRSRLLVDYTVQTRKFERREEFNKYGDFGGRYLIIILVPKIMAKVNIILKIIKVNDLKFRFYTLSSFNTNN